MTVHIAYTEDNDDYSEFKTAHFSPKWKGLNQQSLFDVYAVHKGHRYTFQQMDDYPLSEFLENATKSDDSIFGNIGISESMQTHDFKDRADRLSLFPSWIINDDVFSIIPIIYGVTNFARNLKQSALAPSAHSIRVYVIPQSIISVYDQSIQFVPDIPSIEQYLELKESDIYLFRRNVIASSSYTAADIGKSVQDLYDDIRSVEESRSETRGDEAMNIVMLFDRRKCTETGKQSMLVFECRNWQSFDELKRNNLIGFDLEIDGGDDNDDGGDVVRAYLNYGIGQRIRFYPEFMVSVFAKLFVTPSSMTEYEYLQNLYSAECKKGWNLNLDDQRFNDIYKAMTGTDHETNNYYRADDEDKRTNEQKFGFFRFVESRFDDEQSDVLNQLMEYWESNRYDSDTVIFDILDQNTKNEKESNIGLYMKGIGRSEWMKLKQAVFDWKQMECGAENTFNITECERVQRLIGNLQRFKECNYVIHSENAKTFNLEQIIGDFDHLICAHNLFSGDDTLRIQRYIANQIGYEKSSDSVVLDQFRNRRRGNEKHSELDRNDGVSSECAVLAEKLCEIHCYLLHRSDELYRLSSESEEAQSKFTSFVKSVDDQKHDKKEEEPLSIDFGISVIRWLKFGEEPQFQTLRDEMIQNKDITVSEGGYARMELECSQKIKSNQFSDYSVDEMKGFKFYSDYSEACANLRKAHWVSRPLKTKKRFYHWARTIYRASLRHAVPIPIHKDHQKGAQWLYHGLSLLFRMDRESPTYFGPFSTTLSVAVSDSFSNQKGLRLHIKSGYEDSMTRCLGIDMQSISCFKNEKEVLLVDQPIPIQRTKTWDSDDAVLINHFLYSLKTRSTEIRDQKEFYKKLGVKYRTKWSELILKHDALYAESKYDGKLVIQRLVNELCISDVICGSKYCPSKLIDSFGVDENGHISLNLDPSGINGFTVWNPTKSENQDLFSLHEFVVQNVTENVPECMRREKCYRFSDINDFKIPISNHHTLPRFVEAVSIGDAIQRQDYHIQIAVRVHDVFDGEFVIKTLDIAPESVFVDQIHCNSMDPFRINERVKLLPFDETVHRGGKLCIASNSSIIIGKDCGIDAAECGLCRNSKLLTRDSEYELFGRFIGNSEDRNVSEVGDGAGGGIIGLAARGSIVNDGMLSCDPSGNGLFSGGTISIMTVGEFVNTGRMSCCADGAIDIQCGKIMNEGYIGPIPMIRIISEIKAI